MRHTVCTYLLTTTHTHTDSACKPATGSSESVAPRRGGGREGGRVRARSEGGDGVGLGLGDATSHGALCWS
eukprot:1608110-Rhodomonas_salina.2